MTRDEYFQYYVKLPFCCEAIKGKLDTNAMWFKYINNFKDFSFETMLKSNSSCITDNMFVPHQIHNRGKYYYVTFSAHQTPI